MADVSVVVPTRNRSAWLAQALGSAMRQADVDVEVVVVDDASDASAATVVDAVALTAPGVEVRLLRHESRRGVSAARNTGIAAASAPWIAFLDDDDVWAPTKLACQLRAAGEARARWAYAGDVAVDAGLRVVAGSPPPTPAEVVRDLDRYNAVPAGCSNVVVARSLLDEVGGFDESLTNQEDWDLWLRLKRLGEPACAAEPLVAYRIHLGNASRAVGAMLRELEVVARRHGVAADRRRHRRWAAWTCLQGGDRWGAARHYLAAVRGGDASSLARAAAAVVAPRAVVARRSTAEETPWTVAAQRWLDEVPPS